MRRAFSLIELLAVVAVIVILMALAAPAFTGLAPTRKTALSELKGFVDAARVLAKKEGRDVYLAFSDDSTGADDSAFRRYALFKARGRHLIPGETLLNRDLEQASRWETLPPGMVFARGEDFAVAAGGRLRTVHDLSDTIYVRAFSFVENDERVTRRFPFFLIGPGGRVEIPAAPDADALHIGIAEGHYSNQQGRVLVKASGSGRARAECLKINRYTGNCRFLTD